MHSNYKVTRLFCLHFEAYNCRQFVWQSFNLKYIFEIGAEILIEVEAISGSNPDVAANSAPFIFAPQLGLYSVFIDTLDGTSIGSSLGTPGPSVVPEPGTAFLFCLGRMDFTGVSRRKA